MPLWQLPLPTHVLSVIRAVIAGGLLITSLHDVHGQVPERRNRGPIHYTCETRSVPRPLKLHLLKIDLSNKDYELDVALGADPDGDGPVEASLTPPTTLSRRAGFLAAVNANAWTMVRPGQGYVVGGASDISGWAKNGVPARSEPEKSHWSFWVDAKGRAHIDNIAKPVAAVCAAAGFGGLIRAGKILPEPSDVLHPRSALGLDRSGRWLTLAVVDGRRQGYSEGVSLRELAEIMHKAGCWNALNLDGGGSSIMLMANDQHELEIRNRPSGRLRPRPIPVMMGVRRRDQHGISQ